MIYKGGNDFIKKQLDEKEININLIDAENNIENNIPINHNYNIFEKKGEFNLKIIFKTVIINGYGLFSCCENLTYIDLYNFNTSLMDNFSYMFFNCYNLKCINLNSFDTSKMINMKYMFYGCQNLKDINVSSFNTCNVVDSTGLFGNCRSLVNLNISNFNIKNLKNMDYMFQGCENLENIIVNEQLFNQIGDILKNYNITIIYS